MALDGPAGPTPRVVPPAKDRQGLMTGPTDREPSAGDRHEAFFSPTAASLERTTDVEKCCKNTSSVQEAVSPLVSPSDAAHRQTAELFTARFTASIAESAAVRQRP